MARAKKRKIAETVWTGWGIGLILGVTLARAALNAPGLIPVHFDEAQYWLYGEDLAFGYYSKPPLVAWAIRLSTELFGDRLFGLRVLAPLAQGWIAWLILATGRRMFDARTGFWAGIGYLAAPGVTASSALMTTDPLMMLGWAGALYALTRVLTHVPKKGVPEPGIWWLVLGLSLGLGIMAKYTALVLAGGCLGYALLSRDGPLVWRGPLKAAGVALAVWAPNLIWLAMNRFASVAHLSENADTGRSLTPEGLPEFLVAQAGVIGPVFLMAMAALIWQRSAWRGDWRLRLLVWLSLPLVLAMCVQAVRGGANANWAAPSFVAGSLLAAHWLVSRGWITALRLHLGLGVLAGLILWGLAFVYDGWGTGLPRVADPFKKMRIGPQICERVIAAMEDTGVDQLLSPDRRRLSECAFEAGLYPRQLRIWNPTGQVTNHFEMTASLAREDIGPMLLVLLDETGERQARQFDFAELVDEGSFATHADRQYDYAIWQVEGFRGY